MYAKLFLTLSIVFLQAMQLGLAVSVELCVKALRLPNQDVDAKTMVCKAVACLLPDDLEVIRACQLTEFLLCPAQEAFDVLEELYMRPDQKYDEENAIIPNFLRCELLLSLKALLALWSWILGLEDIEALLQSVTGAGTREEVEDEAVPEELCNVEQFWMKRLGRRKKVKVKLMYLAALSKSRQWKEQKLKRAKSLKEKDSEDVSKRYVKQEKNKFVCQICHKEVVETRICHHARKHMEDDVWTCPVCLQKLKVKRSLSHTLKHTFRFLQRVTGKRKKWRRSTRNNISRRIALMS